MEDKNHLLEEAFSDNTFIILTTGSILASGGFGRVNPRITEIDYKNPGDKIIAKVVSTDPRSSYIRDRMALMNGEGQTIIKFDVEVTSHHGFFPKVKRLVENSVGEAYCNISYDNKMLPYISFDESTIVYSKPYNPFVLNYGVRLYSSDSIVATIERNKTGFTTFNGYNFEILNRDFLKYIIPCSIGYMKDWGMISGTS